MPKGMIPERRMDESRRTLVGTVAFAAFLGCVPLANWMILHVGTVCVPNGPCLVPDDILPRGNRGLIDVA